MITGKQAEAIVALVQETQALQDAHWKARDLHSHLPCPDLSEMDLGQLLLRRRELLGVAPKPMTITEPGPELRYAWISSISSAFAIIREALQNEIKQKATEAKKV